MFYILNLLKSNLKKKNIFGKHEIVGRNIGVLFYG